MSDVFYPPVAFSFSLSIDGEDAEAGGFSEVSGLGAEVTVAEVSEGSENRFVHKLPGHVKNTNLVLRRGLISGNGALMRWLQKSLDGDLAQAITPKDLTLAMLNEKGAPVMEWALAGAWPVSWSMGAFQASQNQAAIEKLEIACRDVRRRADGGALGPT